MTESDGTGVRERKRQETLRRITEAGIRLFGTKGYERATLDEIAAEAGISRRTFFHYFKSKDEILLSLQRGLGAELAAILAGLPASGRPLDAVRNAMRVLADRYPPDELIKIDRLMRSSAAVQARKQASYVEDEATLFAALREKWPEENEAGLRLVAMLSVGVSRLALETFNKEDGRRPLAVLLDEAFGALDAVSRPSS